MSGFIGVTFVGGFVVGFSFLFSIRKFIVENVFRKVGRAGWCFVG